MASLELALIRNELYKKRFSDEYLDSLLKIKKDVVEQNNPFSGLVVLCINNALNFIEKNDYLNAAIEIGFIHNFPIYENLRNWNEDHFYTIELLGYIEKIEDKERIKNVLREVAKFL